MNRLLKIVGGPLKGAEIALVAGTKVKVGSGDECDILVADPTLGSVAFELDVAEDEVTLTTPDGAAKTMLDFEAREFGSSAFAIGPAEGAWQEIVWPAKEQAAATEEQPAENAEAKPAESDGAEQSEEQSEDKPAEGEAKDEEKKEKGFGCLPALIILLVLIALIAGLGWYFRAHPWVVLAREKAVCLYEQSVTIWRGWFPDREEEAARIEAAKPKIGDIAAKYGLKLSEVDGKLLLSGNFKTRMERLRVTAEAYSVQPGVELDLSDDESLFVAATDLLKMVTDGRIALMSASNRVVSLKGYAPSAEALHDILVALNTDVPRIAKADCRNVTCGTGKTEEEYESPILPGVTPKPRKLKSTVSPNLPVCGILTTPYPCLILKNGSRVMEGGEFGGCIIEKIGTDAVTLRNNSGSFEWRP
mgnify:CR=1 FL=1